MRSDNSSLIILAKDLGEMLFAKIANKGQSKFLKLNSTYYLCDWSESHQ